MESACTRAPPGDAAVRAEHVESNFFEALPKGAAEFDHVLVMRDVPVIWSSPTADL